MTAIAMIKRVMLLVAAAPLALLVGAPTSAQDSNTSANTSANTDAARRIERLERELRAVQRRVFQGSESGLFTPEVQPQDSVTAPVAPNSSTPVGDLSARIDAIESQLASLTGQIEQQGFRQREMTASIARLRSELGARIDALSATNPVAPVAPAAVGSTPARATSTTPRTTLASAAAPAAARTTPAPVPAAARTTPVTAAARTTPAPRPATRPAATAPAPAAANAARRTRVEAIEVPASGNAAEDAYLYGYRLWEAQLYPEAQAQLQRVLETYPNHRRASYAGNLLGRAYLDNNQPSLAVQVLYDNYRTRPRGERAADSVYFMGMALIRLDRRPDACRTFEEFDRAYGASASQSLKDQVAAGRVQARC